MQSLELLYKYMAHLYQVEESSFLELINTPFSNIPFTDDELLTLRQMEASILANRSFSSLLAQQ